MRLKLLFFLCFCAISAARGQQVYVGDKYYYVPNTAQITNVRRAQDLSLSAGLARFTSYQALEIQSVYAATNRVAVMLNYFDAGHRDVRKGLREGTKYQFGEAGVGLYEALPRGTASVFGGFGYGALFNAYSGLEAADFSILRWFVQPGIEYYNEYFQAGLALRLSQVAFVRGDVSFDIDAYQLEAIQNIEEKSPLFLPELSFNTGMRLPPFALTLHLTTIFPKTDGLNFVRLNTQLSLSATFGARKRK
jgi:hypothetical protein